MEKFVHVWRSAHSFVLKNFLILFLLPLGIWGISEIDIPRDYPYMEMEYASDASYSVRGGMAEMAAPMMAKSSRMASNFIASDIVMADDGFAEVEESERKIIKNGNIDIQVDDTEVMKKEIESKIKQFSGKIQNINSWQVRAGVLGYNITARIPVERLDEVLTEIGKLGQKTSEGVSSQDITRQYFDTENRLKNLEARRDRLRKLLEFETENLADVLSVDREITNVQNEIDSLTSTQNRRDTDVALSTLRIGIQPLPQIGDTGNPHWSAKQSWKQSVNNLIEKSQGLFDWALKYIVLAPIWLPILLILIWVKRRFWKKK